MASVTYHVPCLTTLAAARAAAGGMADARAHPLVVRSLQELHGAVRQAPAMSTGTADLATQVGSVRLPNPIMTASGTSGHGTELADYGDLSALGAVVVKSLSVRPWAGNPAPRVHEVGTGMLNSVGLQGPGLGGLAGATTCPRSTAAGARVVVSIWGQSVDDYGRAAAMLAQAARRRLGHRGRRGQRELSQRGGPLADVRPLGSGDGARCWPPPSAGCPGGPS